MRWRRGHPANDPCPRVGRVDDGVNLEQGGHVDGLAAFVGERQRRPEELVALLRIRRGIELLAKPQPDGALQTHAAELAGGPRDGEERRVEVAAGHRLRAEAIALAEHDGEQRDREARGGHEHP